METACNVYINIRNGLLLSYAFQKSNKCKKLKAHVKSKIITKTQLKKKIKKNRHTEQMGNYTVRTNCGQKWPGTLKEQNGRGKEEQHASKASTFVIT